MHDFDHIKRQRSQGPRPDGPSAPEGQAWSVDRPLDPPTALSLQRSAGNGPVSELVARLADSTSAPVVQAHWRPYAHSHDEEEAGSLLAPKAGRGAVLAAEAGALKPKAARGAGVVKKVYDYSKEQAERAPVGKGLKYVGYGASIVGKAVPVAEPASTVVSGAQKLYQAHHARKLWKEGVVNPLISSSEEDFEAQERLKEVRGRGAQSDEYEED